MLQPASLRSRGGAAPSACTPRFRGVISGYRFYNASTGRWLSRDPIGEKGGSYPYVFVANHGVTVVDPFGLEEIIVSRHFNETISGVATRDGEKTWDSKFKINFDEKQCTAVVTISLWTREAVPQTTRETWNNAVAKHSGDSDTHSVAHQQPESCICETALVAIPETLR